MILRIPMPIPKSHHFKLPSSSVLGYSCTAHGWPTTIHVGHGGATRRRLRGRPRANLQKVLTMRICKDIHGDHRMSMMPRQVYEYPWVIQFGKLFYPAPLKINKLCFEHLGPKPTPEWLREISRNLNGYGGFGEPCMIFFLSICSELTKVKSNGSQNVGWVTCE